MDEAFNRSGENTTQRQPIIRFVDLRLEEKHAV